MSNARSLFVAAVEKHIPGAMTLIRSEIVKIVESENLTWPQWFTNDPTYRVSRGVYNFDLVRNSNVTARKPRAKKPEGAFKENIVPIAPLETFHDSNALTNAALTSVEMVMNESFIPDRAKGYVPFGNYKDVRSIVASKKFYPTYVTGLSGNGKTMMIEQVCEELKREFVRVNVTIETDEDDLIGGFRLVDGQTVWQNGPVVVAMERGAILLLDEVDLGSNRLMCLQPVLEGKSIYLKKINKKISPMPGFNVFATANTKGRGSDDGRFIGTNVMNEAFLERFSITMEQDYPSVSVEKKILKNVLSSSNNEDNDFVDKLVTWGDMIRKAFTQGAINDIISTRRLVHICEAFVIFGNDRMKAIELCLNRFDSETKQSFMEYYTKIDASSKIQEKSADNSDDLIAF